MTFIRNRFGGRNTLVTAHDIDDDSEVLPARLGTQAVDTMTGMLSSDAYFDTLTEAVLSGCGWAVINDGTGNEMPVEGHTWGIMSIFAGELALVLAIDAVDGATYSQVYGDAWRRLDVSD